MAIRQVLVDDLDGSTDDVHTVTFALDTAAYTIDLSPTNHDKLAAALAPFIRAGRRQPRTATLTGPARDSTRHSRQDNSRDVRAWWRDNAQLLGLPPAHTNGAIPARVLAAYRDRTTTTNQHTAGQ